MMITPDLRKLQLLFLIWVGTDTQFDEPFFDIGADHIGMILLQVVQTGTKLHDSTVLQALYEALSKGWRDQGTRVSDEEQLWVRRLGESTVGVLHSRIHICRFSLDRQLIRESPGGSSRCRSRKGCSVNRHLLVRQLPNGCRRKDSFNKRIAFKDHLLADTGSPEFLEGFNLIWVKVIPGRHWPDELHESEPADKVGPASRQVKCQSRTPVLSDHEC